MSGTEIIALAAAGAAAGLINAVAGGGTLITFPALLFFGTPPVTANATSTLALVFGTAGSVYGFRQQIPAVMPWLKRFLPVSLLGGLIGGILLTKTREEVFARLVPFLILFATIIFVTQGAFRRFAGFGDKPAQTAAPHRREIWAAILFQFFVSVYGGYFGAGIGILMLASLGYLGLTDIHEMNCLKTVLGSLINQVAAIYFIFAGLIDWPKTLVMTAGAVAGYFLGAHFSLRIPQKRVRQIISGVGFIISAVMFYRQFR
ncbi:MAG TPA: sulfite exporter TauE/SafE family protein [Candidatus Angelobacter sp.]|nr:sulfite exporter TauE/SafE family protein [Candidatus Angelobacter sp.]